MVDFGLFVESLSSILGEFKLKQVSPEELFFHPYIYARVYISGVDVGYIGRLNPSIQEELNLFDTFIAEIDLEATFPKHKNASSISNFQGVFKDLSVLINKYVTYSQISNAIKVVQKNNPLIKRFFIIDLYEDESLGDKKSLTIRLFLQSDKSTLSDSEIEDTVNQVLDYLSISCGAELR
jgi:phenylalanyl-tRNA synthetase beta chain